MVQLDDFRLVIPVPTSGLSYWMPGATARVMFSQATSLRLIRSQMTILVPDVYVFDPT